MWMWGHTPHRKAPMPVHKSSHSTYSNTAARTKFGAANAAAGLSGEKWLLKKLSAQFPDAHIWFSVRTPARTGQKRYNSDIDLVVVNGRRVILIDAKRWEAGHVYWSLFGVPMQGWRRMRRSNTPMKPSRNMAMAQSRVAQDLPGAHVTSMVIYTPTKRGLPTSVRWLRWPGGIRSYLPGDGLHAVPRRVGDTAGGTCRGVRGAKGRGGYHRAMTKIG